MNKLIDYNCTYDNAVGVSAGATEALGLTFPDAYLHADTMAQIALALKVEEGADFCLLPFCHTVEAEAMGGHVNYGDANTGPRAANHICATAEELLALPPIDFTTGRIAQLLEACRILLARGEEVVLMISGPFTILNVLIDARHAFRIMRKQPAEMQRILDKLGTEILRFVEEAQNAGVKLICYADSSGGLNILGPKNMEYIVEQFTYPLMQSIEPKLGDDCVLLLCPKTTFALLGTGKAQWKDVELPGPMGYGRACSHVAGRVKFVGQTCIKNIGYELKNAKLKGLVLC